MTAIAYPYLRPQDESVTATDWLLLADGAPVEIVDGSLQHFDYSTELRVSRCMSVDLVRVADAISLDPHELKLLCVVSLGTGGTRLERARQVIFREEIAAGRESLDVELPVDSRAISQLMTLTTELVLLSPGKGGGRLSPRTPGARLWRDMFRVMVEPTGSRFPIEAVSFRSMLRDGPSDALWLLDWSPQNIDHDFVSSVRLYINQDVPEFVEAIQRADELVLRMLITSVATQMIRSAIQVEHYASDAGGHSPASVGSVIQTWIERSFPAQTIGSVRTLAEHDPAKFEAALGAQFTGELDDE